MDVKYYREINGNNPIQQQPSEPQPGSLTNQELIIKRAYGITDEEEALFRQSGITDFFDMGEAKHLMAKYSVTIEEVIGLKLSRGDWQLVEEELENR